MKKMIDEIQARGAMVAVMDVSAGPILGQYHKVFYQLAQEKGAIFIPSMLNGIITNPNFKSDFIHPNADGYKVIAQRVYRTILPYLNQNTLIKRYGK
jgi:lysophospholipase L1-like esterase